MAEAPSLGEIINIERDPGGGAVTPRAKWDTQELVHNVNQAAQFKAENDWRKYSTFLGQLKDTYKELGDLQGLNTAQADKPYLQKQAADIFKQIGDDPKAFFGGKMGDIEGKIGKLKSESAQSMQDKVYDDAHRAYMERDPSLQTDDNKQILDGYFKQPLGQRKPYMLKLPSLFNPQEIANQINAAIPQKFSNTGLSSDGRFINTVSGVRYDPDQFKTLADQMYTTPDPKTGRIVSDEVAGRFKVLPPNLQEMYKQKYPEDPVKGFYDETVMPWRKRDEIDKTESKDNAFALEAYKNRDKLQDMSVKFGYDKVLKEMELGNEKDLATFKKNLQNKTKKEQTGALNGMVDSFVNKALLKNAPDSGFWDGSTIGENGYTKMDVSASTLNIFSTTKTVGGKAQKIQPDELQVSKDGKTVKAIYKKADQNGEKEETFPIDEFKVRFGKDVLGVSATEKEINADGEDSGSGLSPTSSNNNKSKTYTLGEKKFTYDQIEKGAKKYGLTIDEYIKQTGLK
jgi:hypothetical protein